MMKLEVLNNNFIEIEDLIKTLHVKCNIINYQYENKILKGNFEIEGEYVNDSSNFELPFNFIRNVPFEIMFVTEIDNITNVNINKFEYFEVERRGIEFEIELSIDYNEIREVSQEVINNENNEYENIKEEVQNNISHILDSTLDTNEKSVQIYPTSTKRTKIKIL